MGLALLGMGLAQSGRTGAVALGEVPFAPGPGQPMPNITVSATALGDNEAVICLVDRLRDRLLVYLADAKRSRLKLLAARDISADWLLADWNNDPPLPKEIRAMAEKATEPAKPAGATSNPKPETSP